MPVWSLNCLLLATAPCGAAAAPVASEIMSRASQLPDGPSSVAEAVEAVVAREWWKADMRLTNLLFSSLRKALVAGVVPRDVGSLVQTCCDAVRGTFGRGTRFFLQVLADLMQHCGAGGRHEVVLTMAAELSRTAWTHKLSNAVGEHDVPIVNSAVLVVERMVNRSSSGPLVAHLHQLCGADAASLSLVAQVAARCTVPLLPLLTPLLEAASSFCNFLLDDAAMFQQVYVGMASVVSHLPLHQVEMWLWDHVLTGHVVAAHLLACVWAFVMRHSTRQVQTRHLTLLLDCFESLPARRQCQRRVAALFASVFLGCCVAAQCEFVSARLEAIVVLPSWPDAGPNVVAAACMQISNSMGQLSSEPSFVVRLSALCRIGALHLTNSIAAPLAQSVREVFLRLGASNSSLCVRDQRAAVVLLSSLAMWFAPDELRKYFGRLLQARSVSPLASVALVGRVAALIDSTCVDVVAALLSAAFTQKQWYMHVGAMQAFRQLSTDCLSLDAALLQRLAGSPGSKQAEFVVAFLSMSSKTTRCDVAGPLLAQAVAAGVPKKAQSVAVTGPSVSAQDFAAFTMGLVSAVKSLHSLRDSDMAHSDRFQAELGQMIALLESMRRRTK